MSDEELVAFATRFRDAILGDAPSDWTCSAICTPLVALLLSRGVVCERIESDLGHCNHFWIRLADGRSLDPTADQFNHFGDCDFPRVYLGPPAVIHAVDDPA